MKKIIITSLIVLVNTISYSQDIFDKVAQESCECIAKKKSEKKSTDKKNTSVEFGVCVINSYSNHASEFTGEKFDLNDTEAMRKLGEKVALKMLTYCPDSVMELADDDEKEVADKNLTITGEITEIKTEQFVSIVLKDEKSRLHTFILLDYFDTAGIFTDNKLNKKDKVSISYIESELYDPKMKEFRYFKIITGLEKK